MWCVNWAEVEAIGTWVAGIGTIGTVFVALHLARKSQVGRVRLVAGFRDTIQGSSTRSILFIEVTNIGSRNLTIDRIAWRLGKKKRRELFQMLNTQAFTLPKLLADGEKVYFEIEKEEWIKRMIEQIGRMDKNFLDKKILETLQIGASATNGQDFWQGVESGVKDELIKEAKSFLEKNKNVA